MASNTEDAESQSVVRVFSPVNIGLVLIGVAYAALTIAGVIEYPWLAVVLILVGGGVITYRAYRRDS